MRTHLTYIYGTYVYGTKLLAKVLSHLHFQRGIESQEVMHVVWLREVLQWPSKHLDPVVLGNGKPSIDPVRRLAWQPPMGWSRVCHCLPGARQS